MEDVTVVDVLLREQGEVRIDEPGRLGDKVEKSVKAEEWGVRTETPQGVVTDPYACNDFYHSVVSTCMVCVCYNLLCAIETRGCSRLEKRKGRKCFI